jgi:ferredoxin, 2Fe-2S
MGLRNKDITVNVIYDGNEYDLKTYSGEYRSLMALIYDNIYTEDFGQCRGMGRCGTCLIEVLENATALSAFDRNEENTLKKMGIVGLTVRLACQIPVNASLDGMRIRIFAN